MGVFVGHEQMKYFENNSSSCLKLFEEGKSRMKGDFHVRFRENVGGGEIPSRDSISAKYRRPHKTIDVS